MYGKQTIHESCSLRQARLLRNHYVDLPLISISKLLPHEVTIFIINN